MKKNYRNPIFRPVFLAGASSLMAAASGQQQNNHGSVWETEDGFHGSFEKEEGDHNDYIIN